MKEKERNETNNLGEKIKLETAPPLYDSKKGTALNFINVIK